MKKLPLEIFAIYFSGYSAHVIEKDGIIYPTLEHAYHCMRYMDDSIITEIKNARSPVLAWEISQKYKQLQIPNFSEKKLDIMKSLIELKVLQHKDVAKALLDSGDLEIIKHIITGPNADSFWDDGEDGTGLNHVGKIWMDIREKIRNK